MPCSPASFFRYILSAALSALVLSGPVPAQQPVPTPQVTTPVVIVPAPMPAPIPPSPPAPVRRVPEPIPTLSPADQLAAALNDRDLTKVMSLLQGDPTLAKTPSSEGTPPLISALRNFWGYDNSSKQIVQTLLDDGADVNAADRGGTTPLQALLMRGNGNADGLLLLLNKGADIKAQNGEGKNALHLAVSGGDTGSVKLLLSRGADVNARSLSGDTPLHLAITAQNQDMIDTLLGAGANVNLRNNQGEMPIHLAMRLTALQSVDAVPARFAQNFGRGARMDKTRGNPLLVPQLLDRGAQINARDQSGVTPLLFALLNRDKINYAVLMQRHAAMDSLTTLFNAAATNDTGTLAHLLKTLPDFKDLRAPTGATALHVAALWNAPEAARLLLHGGLETSARDAAQETPLHYACWFPQNAPMIGLLLDAGSNINAEDAYGETPLHLSVHTLSPEVMRLLLARKASSDLPNNSGETPLSLAVSRGDLDMATQLVTAGASVNGHSRFGGSLLVNAIQSRNTPMVTLLLAKGADVNYVSEERGGESALMMAVENDNKEMVQLLLDKGADAGYKTRYGQSVLSMARNYNNSGIADMLKQHGAK